MLSTLPAPFWTDITQVCCTDEAAGAGYGLPGGVRFDRQYHQIACPQRPNLPGDLHRSLEVSAVGHVDPDPAVLYGGDDVLTKLDQRYILTGVDQEGSQKAADIARADDRYLHWARRQP